MSERFTGFPREGLDFFRRLGRHNDRDWFQAHRDVYERACRAPMQALAAELDPFGPSRISRINRDLRFSADKSPYKTNISCGVAGIYLFLSADGLWVGSGLYKPEPARLARLREAIGADASGKALQRIVTSLRRKGFDVATHASLRSAPRGFPADHPRSELLRMKDIYAGKQFGPEPWLATRAALPRIKGVMRDIRPFNAWLRRYAK